MKRPRMRLDRLAGGIGFVVKRVLVRMVEGFMRRYATRGDPTLVPWTEVHG